MMTTRIVSRPRAFSSRSDVAKVEEVQFDALQLLVRARIRLPILLVQRARRLTGVFQLAQKCRPRLDRGLGLAIPSLNAVHVSRSIGFRASASPREKGAATQ